MAELFATGSHWAIGAFLSLFGLHFLWRYVRPGWRLGQELRSAHRALTALKAQGAVLDLDAVERQAMPGPSLPHCWSEYRDTLHRQYGVNAMGERVVTRLRATAMAGAFFNETTLVDARLGTEFFKHLPGILTGLGIIGTFSGLIFGLQGFQVSDDASLVRQSLQGLLQAVGGAFMVSASAIFLAMVVTLVEKGMINRRLAEVERLVGLIDSLFDSGAGEEYLQQLVESGERSATQAQQLKETLVSDLRGILQELTQAQIQASVSGHQQTAQAIGDAIHNGLREPLERISTAVQSVSQQQGDAVNRLLTDVLANFSQQMREMFGGQMQGMNEVLAETARSIQAASSRFDTLAAQLQSAGDNAAGAMAQRMEALMESLSARQAEADARMAEFLKSVQHSVNEGQSQSAELMMNTFAELSQTTSALVSELRHQADRAAQDSAQQVRQISAETADLMERQTTAVSALVQALGQQVERSAQDNAQHMRQLGTEAAGLLAQQSASVQSLVQSLGQQSERAAQDQAQQVRQIGAEAASLLEQQSASVQSLVQSLGQQSERAAQDNAQQVRQISAEASGLLEQQSAAVQTLVAALGRQVEQATQGSAEQMQHIGAQASGLLAQQSAAVQALVQSLGQQSERSAQDSAEQMRLISAEAAALLQRQAALVQTLVQSTEQATTAMRQAGERVVTGVNASVDRMATGAERLHGASSVLEGSLGQMSTAARTVDQSVQELRGASTDLSTASRAAAQALNEQQAVRESIQGMVEQLGQIVDNAKREASMTSTLVGTLKDASEALNGSTRTAEDYLKQVNEVLAGAHDTFASHLTATLRQGNATFQEELAQAVDMLRGAIQDLGDTLDSLPAAR